MVTDSCPFRTADDANVLDRQNSKEQILVCAVVPVLVVHDADGQVAPVGRAAGKKETCRG